MNLPRYSPDPICEPIILSEEEEERWDTYREAKEDEYREGLNEEQQ